MGCKEDLPLTVGVEEVTVYSLTDKVAAVEVQLQELEEAVVTVLIDVPSSKEHPVASAIHVTQKSHLASNLSVAFMISIFLLCSKRIVLKIFTFHSDQNFVTT